MWATYELLALVRKSEKCVLFFPYEVTKDREKNLEVECEVDWECSGTRNLSKEQAQQWTQLRVCRNLGKGTEPSTA